MPSGLERSAGTVQWPARPAKIDFRRTNYLRAEFARLGRA